MRKAPLEGVSYCRERRWKTTYYNTLYKGALVYVVTTYYNDLGLCDFFHDTMFPNLIDSYLNTMLYSILTVVKPYWFAVYIVFTLCKIPLQLFYQKMWLVAVRIFVLHARKMNIHNTSAIDAC